MSRVSNKICCCFLIVAIAGNTSLYGAAVGAYLKKTEHWFRSPEAKQVAHHILSWQAREGGWPKNVDTTVAFTGDTQTIKGTFDNGATTDELRFLARMTAADTNDAYTTAFRRGLDHVLTAQYTNGGWPQYSPPPQATYHRHITFNDNTMVRLLMFVREVATDARYSFVPNETRQRCQRAFDRGVECILASQVRANAKLTAWCAQHDEVDLTPRKGRAYELESLSGSESAAIVKLLMRLEKPSPAVIRSVESAMAWFEAVQIRGIRVVEVKANDSPKSKDRIVVQDSGARPMWARFYEIETNRPIFSGRDGIKKYSFGEIEYERRSGYSWLGYWPAQLLEEDFPAWKERIARGKK